MNHALPGDCLCDASLARGRTCRRTLQDLGERPLFVRSGRDLSVGFDQCGRLGGNP